MTPTFPVIELFDRLAVAQVKWEKTAANHAELAWYISQVANYDFKLVENLFETLKQTHRNIWELEAELKSGKEHELPLEELGRRAICIRDHNHKRIAIKNQMAEILDCPVREIKKNHLSE
jgi:hypothetical protein